jgi:hypothetical protein
MSILNNENHWSANKLTLDELAQIEVNAERSKTPEAETILRLAAALREAMQVSEGALACMTALKNPTHLRRNATNDGLSRDSWARLNDS